ncbi:MAG: hypothetical protein N4A45_05475 [Flavobacteriales bacterium]|jgi:flagellar biosynthesis chaperone FliJ|nr:hypothetical protein [Flavobacteriales bacterium]
MKFIKHKLLASSHSMGEFYDKLENLGLNIYHKKGIPLGIEDIDGKRYSWQKLAIREKDFEMLNSRHHMKQIHQRLDKLEKLQKIREEKENHLER